MSPIETRAPIHTSAPSSPDIPLDPQVQRYITRYPHLTPDTVQTALSTFYNQTERGASVSLYLDVLRDRAISDLARQMKPDEGLHAKETFQVAEVEQSAGLGLLTYARLRLAQVLQRD